MNTARLKNIVILILLLANAFLLVLLFSRRAEENAAHERSVAQLTALLNADGIAFDSALLDGLPDTVLSVQPARDLAAEQALAEGIIGSVTSIDSGGGIYRYYSSDGLNSGSCLIRSGGALEAAVSRAVDDPAEFCADLCVPLGYRTFDASATARARSSPPRASSASWRSATPRSSSPSPAAPSPRSPAPSSRPSTRARAAKRRSTP